MKPYGMDYIHGNEIKCPLNYFPTGSTCYNEKQDHGRRQLENMTHANIESNLGWDGIATWNRVVHWILVERLATEWMQ